MPPRKRREHGAGTVDQLPSGRYRARFRAPDGQRVTAPSTFDTRGDAVAWLNRQHQDAVAGHWQPEQRHRVATLRAYAETWLEHRPLKPRTRELYRDLLDDEILPALGALRLDRITPTTVTNWYRGMGEGHPTRRAHAYGLLRTIMRSAWREDLIAANPCRVEGGGSVKRQRRTTIASLAELDTIVAAMPERYRAMVLLAAWCGLRFGELAELRRSDLDLDAGVVHVQRGVVRVGGVAVVGTPKSEAGVRDVTIPAHIVPALKDHLRRHVGRSPRALLFPGSRTGEQLRPSSLARVWYPARKKAGRTDLRFHDLRHTGLTLAAATGATLADLMARAGHSTPQAAMVYQHAVADRDKAIADALSGIAEAKVNPLKRASR